MGKKIIHIDMDAFFASVEQYDNPSLRGKPVAVGGEGERSVVAAASYEARAYGVRSAMPSVMAKRLCPQLIFVKHNFKRYKAVSQNVFKIFRDYTDIVEPLSIDEAFLDVTCDKKGIGSAVMVAERIRNEIFRTTGLTASAGISVNKFLAKIASAINKPNGQYLIKPEDAESFVAELAVEKFYGVGKSTAEKMHRLGIHKGADLRRWDEQSLIRNFGKAGLFFFNIVRGIDEREVENDHDRKSIGAEITYEKDLTTRFAVIAELYKLEKEIIDRLDKLETAGRTITIKVKFSDFRQITKSKTFNYYIRGFTDLHREVTEIRRSIELEGTSIRLLGVSISNLESEESNDNQLLLF